MLECRHSSLTGESKLAEAMHELCRRECICCATHERRMRAMLSVKLIYLKLHGFCQVVSMTGRPRTPRPHGSLQIE